MKAAESGDALAQHKLSEMYLGTLTVTPDYAEAYFWQLIAKRETHNYWLFVGDSSCRVPVFKTFIPRPKPEDQLSSFQKSQIETRARNWKEKHPDLPDAPTPKDLKDYQGWADSGYCGLHCYVVLGNIYRNGGLDIPQDNTLAYFWYSLAARDKPEKCDTPYVKQEREAAAKKLSPEKIIEMDKRVTEWKPQPKSP